MFLTFEILQIGFYIIPTCFCFQAEENAKRKKLRRWANFVEPVVTAAEVEEEDTKESEAERKVHYEKVTIIKLYF